MYYTMYIFTYFTVSVSCVQYVAMNDVIIILMYSQFRAER